MTEPHFVAWRNGKSGFTKWHLGYIAQGRRTLCGADVGKYATWQLSGVDTADLCHSCLAALEAQAPAEETANG